MLSRFTVIFSQNQMEEDARVFSDQFLAFCLLRSRKHNKINGYVNREQNQIRGH